MTTEELRQTLQDVGDLLRKVETNVPTALVDAALKLFNGRWSAEDSVLTGTSLSSVTDVLISFRKALADGSIGRAGDACVSLANKKILLPLVAHLM